MTINSTDFDNAKLDLNFISEVANVNYSLDTATNRSSDVVSTVIGQLKQIGYLVPVTYAASIVFGALDNLKTIEEAGVIYAPLPSALPFTTSGTFIGDDDARFFTIQTTNVVDGSVTLPKLAPYGDLNITIGSGASTNVQVNISGDATLAASGALTIENDAITTDKILDANITTDKIVDLNVTGAKIADTTISASKLDAALAASIQVIDGTLSGCTLSNNGANPANAIDISAGFISDDADSVYINFAGSTSNKNKNIGDADGGFPSALTVAIDTWYQVFICSHADGTNSVVVFDTSPIAANALSDLGGSYTTFRRIGWIKTNPVNTDLEIFRQDGDEFYFDLIKLDMDAAPTFGSRSAVTLSCPPDTTAMLSAQAVGLGFVDATDSNYIYMTRTDQTGTTPSTTHNQLSRFNNASESWGQTVIFNIPADSSSQIFQEKSINESTTTLRIKTLGWIDTRGKH